jgi:mannose-6-phosphate isomerase-like protein (cupin superfamily)
MEKMNRRELVIALSSFAALGGIATLAQAQSQSDDMGAAKNSGRAKKEDRVLDQSQTFQYDQLPVTNLPNGGTQRRVISGVLPTGEYIEVHETVLPPGKMPHPPHRHRNSEVLFIREGKLEFLNNGKPEPVGPGGVVFTASNVLHGLRNVGTTPATYFVIAISRAQKET